MRISGVVKVDSKGRVTIPLFMREALDIHEGRYLVVIADIDKKEIILTPISSDTGVVYEIKVELQDKPGALAEFSSILQKMGLDILMTRCSTIQRGKMGECIAIVEPVEREVSLDDIKKEMEKLEIVYFVSVKPVERGV